MVEVRLRRWRLEDAADVAVMIDDEKLGHWSAISDLDAWIRREVAEERGPTRAICLPHDDRALGRVMLRPPEFASDAVRCEAMREADQPAGELGYWLVPEARGRGLAFAAVRLMLGSVIAASDCARSCSTSRPTTFRPFGWPSGSEPSAGAPAA
jgi:RimJ/RimL family protein N-acetyltransferase